MFCLEVGWGGGGLGDGGTSPRHAAFFGRGRSQAPRPAHVVAARVQPLFSSGGELLAALKTVLSVLNIVYAVL